MAALIGKIGEYREGEEQFEYYLERLEQFFVANAIADDRAVSVFLTVIGPKSYGLLKNLVSPGKPCDKSLEELKVLLKNHYTPEPLVIAERFKFHKRDQKQDETVATYLIELKRLASTCKFQAFLNEAIRDRLVCGLENSTCQKKLLAEKNLTLEKAVDISTAMEMANKQARDMNSSHVADTLGSKPVTVNKIRYKPNTNRSYPCKAKSGQDGSVPKQNSAKSFKPKGSSTCYRCAAEDYDASQCPHKSSTCYNCKKVGHIARACRKKRQQKPKTVKLVSTSTTPSDGDDEFDLYTIKEFPSKSGIMLDVQVGGTPIQMELDTGAAVSILSDTVYKKHLKAWPLHESSVKLRTYAGEAIKVLGCTTVPVKYKDQPECKLPLFVVSGNKPALFGRQWLETIKLDWNSIFKVETTAAPTAKTVGDILQRHKEVFAECGDPIKDFTASVRIPEGTKPMFYKARPVPYALRDKVELELNDYKIME